MPLLYKVCVVLAFIFLYITIIAAENIPFCLLTFLLFLIFTVLAKLIKR